MSRAGATRTLPPFVPETGRHTQGLKQIFRIRSASAGLGMAVMLVSRTVGSIDLAEFRPAPAEGPVFNPGMGIYMQFPPLTLPDNHWMLPLSDIAYYRLDWAPINPEPGVCKFDEIFGPYFDEWVAKRGRRVAFRVMSQNNHSPLEYVTPKWAFEQAGVPGVESTDQLVRARRQVMAVPWSEQYLDVYCAFVAKLGAYLDGRPGLEFVDIGAIGEWGEMHFMRWDAARREAAGYSDFKYIMAQRRVIDAYRRAFPNTRVFLNVGYPKFHTIHDYASSRGIHFRQDGLMPGGAMGNCDDWLYKPYAKKGVLCNLEFWGSYQQMVERGYSLPVTIDDALASPISYLNANLGTFGKEAPQIVKDEIARAAERVGYRLRPAVVRTRREFKVGAGRQARLTVSCDWVNGGTAAPSLNLALQWTLHDAAGMEFARLDTFPPQPTTLWWPGETNRTSDTIVVPKGAAPGRCTLRVAMCLLEDGRRINLDCKASDAERRWTVAELAAIRDDTGTAYPVTVKHETFESGMKGWGGGCKGLTPQLAAGQGADGGAALKVAGTKTQGWSYASCLIEPKPKAFAQYRLSAKIKVASLASDDAAGRAGPAYLYAKSPTIKLQLNDRAGKYIENVVSSAYDMSRPGQWQELSVTAETTEQVGSLYFGWETGNFNGRWNIEACLDDVKLVLLDEP